jgi:TPR repeat protein
MYKKGLGSKQDYGKALELFSKAAEHGNPFAYSDLGGMYQHGFGVMLDAVQAYAWYLLAAEHMAALSEEGATEAEVVQSGLNALDKQLTPEQIATAKRRAQDWKTKNRLVVRSD